MYVKNQLDRETAEIIILEVLVTDRNAATDKKQTATGREFGLHFIAMPASAFIKLGR